MVDLKLRQIKIYKLNKLLLIYILANISTSCGVFSKHYIYTYEELNFLITNHLNKSNSNYPLYIPSGNYSIDKTLIKGIISKNVTIIGRGNVNFYCNAPLIENDFNTIHIIRLNRPLKRGQNTFYLNSSGINKGDILIISSMAIAESAWKYKNTDCLEISNIYIDSIETKEGLNFNYYPKDEIKINIIRPIKIHIENINFHMNKNKISNKAMAIKGAIVTINKLKGESMNSNENFLQMFGCINSTIRNIKINNFQYGILINYCRNINIENIQANNTIHAVVPAYWTTKVKVNGYKGNNTAIDSHPSFDIWYNNVDINTGMTYFNCRALGVKLTNSKIRANPLKQTGSVYIGISSLTSENENLYDQYDIIINNLQWIHSSKESSGFRIYKCRNLKISNTKTHNITTTNFINSISINKCVIGGFYCYDSNFNIKNTKFKSNLQGTNNLQPPLSVSYDGNATITNCTFKGYSNSYLFKYIHSYKTNILFDKCYLDSFKGIALKLGYPNKIYKYIIFNKCKFKQNFNLNNTFNL